MEGTAAIIFWVNQATQVPSTKTYHITAMMQSAITADNTTLRFSVEPTVNVTATSYNLGFVVNASTDTVFTNFVKGPLNAPLPTGKSPFDGTQHDINSGDADFPISTAINYTGMSFHGFPLGMAVTTPLACS
jgi:hypothetical protein